MAISVVLTWLYNATGGRLILTGIAHAAVNGWPIPWGMAVQALPVETRLTATADFHVLITVASIAVAIVLVIATRGLKSAIDAGENRRCNPYEYSRHALFCSWRPLALATGCVRSRGLRLRCTSVALGFALLAFAVFGCDTPHGSFGRVGEFLQAR